MREGFLVCLEAGAACEALFGLQADNQGIAIICIEWWSTEIAIVLSSLLRARLLDARSILVRVLYALYMVPLGVGQATSSRVGHALGASRAAAARFMAAFAVVLNFIVQSLLTVRLHLMRDVITLLFTNDLTISDILVDTALVMAQFAVVDGFRVY